MKVIAIDILRSMGPSRTRPEEVDMLAMYVATGLTVQMTNTGINSMFGVFADDDGSYVVTMPGKRSVVYENARSAVSFMLSRYDAAQI